MRNLLLSLCAAVTTMVLTGCGPSGSSPAKGPEGGEAQGPATAPEPVANGVELVFTYGSEKEEWIKEVTADFNASGAKTPEGKTITVTALPMGSGECVDEVLNGTRQAHLISPASEAFIRLGNAQSEAKTGGPLVGRTDSLVLSPVVIAMWKPMAEALGWPGKPVGWGDILGLARDPQGWAGRGQAQWGKFKFGHTHPEFSNSGLISVFAEIYAGAGKRAGLTMADLQRPEVTKFVADIEQSVVHYGSSTGFFGKKMFANGPRYLSAAVLYENMVIESAKASPALPVVAIYPKEGTFWSDHPAGVVERPWVTPDHRAAAKVYLDFLLAIPQQERAMPHGFRPSDPAVALTAPFDATHGVDPKEPQNTLEVPTTEVMDAALQLWRGSKKPANITLVIDTSGSMQVENRMENAKDGAQQLLSALQPADRFSLMPFSSAPAWAFQGKILAQGRPEAEGKIGSLYPNGGTALYDSVAAAYQFHLTESEKNADRISAIVVLTDGEDTDSKMKLDALLRSIQFDYEKKTIRVFTIGYGSGAQKNVLKSIADATQGKFYEGSPQNIRAVFRDIATFF